MVNTDGISSPRQLTAKEGSSQAVWNPDGGQIAFVRAVDSKPQVFLLSLNGGEAIQLTKFRYGAGTPKWSPDGKQLLFSSNIPLKDLINDSLLNPSHSVPSWSDEKPGFTKNDHLKSPGAKADPDGNIEEIRAYLENDVNDNKAKVVDKLNFQDEMGVNTDISFNHFFLINVDAPVNPIELTKGFYRFSSADFTPDGKQIILSGDVDSVQHPDRSLESEIFIVNTDGSNLKKILGEKEMNFNSPRVSPSGKWLAFQYERTSVVTVPGLAVIPLTGSIKDKTDIPFDRNKGNLVWSNDEKYIYFSAQSNGGQPV
jgi:Tol biopolymer transport system component